jgi:hypothetical protein
MTTENENKIVYSYNVQSSVRELLDATSGKVVITKADTGGTRGTFEFKAYSVKQKKEFIITQGQFRDR